MKIFILALLSFSQPLWAYPEMVRHGYAQCIACHISPAGGGVLNSYGRQLAAEVLSTWSYKNESQFLHSSIGESLAEKGLLFGGDVRAVQTRTEDPHTIEGRLFLMMSDFQTAYQTEHFTGVVSFGQIEKPMSGHIQGNFNSTMYYGYLKFNDEFGVRAGRFMPAYGINLPDHTLAIKEGLRMSPWFQYDSVEASYLSEHWTVLATAATSVPTMPIIAEEQVRALNVSYAFANRMRVGASYWGGRGSMVDRHIFGGNAILGFTSRFYNMSELDFSKERAQDGTFGFSQVAYEVFRGFTPYLQYQHRQDKLTNPSTLTKSYGAGFHFYPRPHFEFSAEYDRMQTAALWSDSAYFLSHYYF
jgi:hypothetical protein